MLDGNNEKLRKRLFMVPQGISADLIATREGFSRADVDEFALASQQKAARAIEGKRFDEVDVRGQERRRLGRARAATSTRAPTRRSSRSRGLQPAFAQMGAMAMGPNGETLDELALSATRTRRRSTTCTPAGNSSGIVDGAAVVLMGSAEWGKQAGLKPRARIRAMATAGAEPVIMLTAPAPASQKALDAAPA